MTFARRSLLFALLCVLSTARLHADAVTRLKSDETVQFFPTAAWFDTETHQWHVPVHAWVYEPERSVVRKTLIEEALESLYGLRVTDANRGIFERRIDLLLSDNERGKRLVLDLAGRRFTLAKTDARGHVRSVLRVAAAELPQTERGRHGAEIEFRVVFGPGEERDLRGRSVLLPSHGLSIVSDIDDTVKISQVLDRRRLAEHTFYQEFAAVPGMAVLYRRLHDQGASLHFVSSSPWHLFAPLEAFLRDSGFPRFTVELKTMRIKDSSILDLFRGGAETKPAQIRPLLRRFPSRGFVLVGDNGEEDPEAYLQMVREHPEQVLAVYIRNVTGASDGEGRYRALAEALGADRFLLFEEPADVESHMQDRGWL